MAGLWNSVSAVLIILMLISVGYIFGRVGWLKKENKPFFSRYIIRVAVPCVCIKNILTNFSRDMLLSSGKYLLVPVLYSLAAYGLAYGLGKLLKLPKGRFGPFVAMCAFSNVIFVGYPICMELFGDAGVQFVMYCYILNTVVFWGLGAGTIYNSGIRGGITFREKLKRVFTPPIFALIFAVGMVLLDLKLPDILMSFCNYTAGTVTPLALMYVGYVMFETGFKNIRPDRYMVAVILVRHVLMPALMFGACTVMGITGVARSVFLIESAMPVMTQSVVVSGLAGADEQYNAQGMVLTTLVSLVVIPVLMLIA